MYNHKDGIILRKIEQKDLNDLKLLKQESWWGTHQITLCNDYDQEQWFKHVSQSNNMQVLIGEHESKPMGVMVLTEIDWISRTLSLSGSVYKQFRDPKIIRSAFAAGVDFIFEMLNMHRIECEVLASHVTAQMFEVKFLGFIIEGRKRQAIYKSGQYYDSIILSQLRSEWIELERIKNYQGSCNKNFDHVRIQKLMRRFSQVGDAV